MCQTDIYAHCVRMAVFDFIVVVVTTISLLPYFDLKVISILRLLRAFRVVWLSRIVMCAVFPA